MDAPTCSQHHERTARLEARMDAQERRTEAIFGTLEKINSNISSLATNIAVIAEKVSKDGNKSWIEKHANMLLGAVLLLALGERAFTLLNK